MEDVFIWNSKLCVNKCSCNIFVVYRNVCLYWGGLGTLLWTIVLLMCILIYTCSVCKSVCIWIFLCMCVLVFRIKHHSVYWFVITVALMAVIHKCHPQPLVQLHQKIPVKATVLGRIPGLRLCGSVSWKVSTYVCKGFSSPAPIFKSLSFSHLFCYHCC